MRINLINIYWFIMKLIVQLCNHLNEFYNLITVCYYSTFNSICLIKNSKIIQTFRNINEIKNYTDQWDYIIYKTKYDNKLLTSIYNNYNDISSNYENHEPCKYEFIFVNLKINNNIYDITKILKNNNSYYYVNNSILFDKSFINWLIIYHLKLQKIDNDYSISLFDNNADKINITNKQYIKLYKNDYEIFTKEPIYLI
jgi:hypothetical protein